MNITKVEQLDQTEDFKLEWKGEIVNFTAKTSGLTPDFYKQIGSVVSFPQAVADNVTEWDVTRNDEGDKWPLTEAELSKLPVPFLDALLGVVMDSWRGDKKKSASGKTGS